MKKISYNHPCFGNTVKQRKQEVIERRFPDYKRRQYKARRRIAIAGMIGIVVTGILAEDNFLLVACACVVGLAMTVPFFMHDEN